MARHRRPVGIRDDGLAAVLAPVIDGGHVDAALLIDVGTGMVLDYWERDDHGDPAGAELLGAAHADVVRAVLAVPGPPVDDLVLSRAADRHHVVRLLADPLGDRLAVSVVVTGGRRAVDRLRRVLGRVPPASLVVEPPRAVPTPEWIPPPRPEPVGGPGGSWTAGSLDVTPPGAGPTPPSSLPPSSPPPLNVPPADVPRQAVPPHALPPPAGQPYAIGPPAVLPQTVLPQTVLPQTVLPQTVLPSAYGRVAHPPATGD